MSAAKAEDGIAIYYIEHDDGDQEDVDVLTATKAVNYYIEGTHVFIYALSIHHHYYCYIIPIISGCMCIQSFIVFRC